MTDRIRDSWIQHELETMKDITGLNLEVSKNSPGDGWTRHRLTEVDPKTGGESDILGFTALTRSELYYSLKTFNRLVERMKQKGNAPLIKAKEIEA